MIAIVIYIFTAVLTLFTPHVGEVDRHIGSGLGIDYRERPARIIRVIERKAIESGIGRAE